MHGDVQSFALDETTELGLGMQQLVVKAAKDSARGERGVVLGEGVVDTEGGESRLVAGFEERAARVAMDYRAELINAGTEISMRSIREK